jgi:predicted enzyme related to lactoylglutathione lyase
MGKLREEWMTELKPRGRFVWFDLMTTDPKATHAFYPAVTGWGTSPWDGGTPYTMWTVNGASIGGVMEIVPGAGHRPHWLAYISAPHVDETVKQAEDLGARVVMPSSDVPNVGRFAVLRDPQGAAFAVFTPETEAPGHDGEAEVGEFSWHELATHDYPAAFRFYERLFGWEKTSAMDMGGGATYQMFGRKGVVLGGMYNKTADIPGSPAWLHYVLVDDIQRATDAVKSNGGQVVSGPMEVPGGSWIAQCIDPQGARFAVHSRAK